MAERMEVRVPDIGDFADVPVIEILVQPGDQVSAEQSLLTLESDKATMEVPAPTAGTVVSIEVTLNGTVSEGDLVAVLEPLATASDSSEAGPETASDATQTVAVAVPDIGDFTDIPVIELLVAVGDMVSAEQSLLTLESDKATMEVPAPVSGRVSALKVALNDTVSEGHVVALIEADEADEATEATASAPEAASEAPSQAPPVSQSAPTPAPVAPPAAAPAADAGQRQSPPVPLSAGNLMPGHVPYASPAIRAFARELGVDLARVSGSGRNGRILRADVSAFVKSLLQGGMAAPAASGFEVAPPPKVDFSKFGPTETQALSRIKKISGKNLHRNWVTIPHVTHNDLADSTEMEAFRSKHKAAAKAEGYNLTPLAFLMKSVVAALQAFPNFNASLDADGENLILKQYYHLGIAVDTPDGLVVPVIRDCDQKSVTELAQELGAVSVRAREGKLKPADWQGASFSISSLGGIGGVSFSPIINAPEVAILGVSRSRMEPVWDGEAFQPRLMLPLSLSYDHRVIDGAQAARFTRALATHIEDPDQLVL